VGVKIKPDLKKMGSVRKIKINCNLKHSSGDSTSSGQYSRGAFNVQHADICHG